jgi:hypothetical protein
MIPTPVKGSRKVHQFRQPKSAPLEAEWTGDAGRIAQRESRPLHTPEPLTTELVIRCAANSSVPNRGFALFSHGSKWMPHIRAMESRFPRQA